MAEAKFMKQIVAQIEKEQDQSSNGVCVRGLILSSFPFLVPNFKILSININFSFLYKLFDMVNDPDTNSVILWSKLGTSFFIKDPERLHNHVQERFNYSIKTFYKTLGDFVSILFSNYTISPFSLHKVDNVQQFT